MIVKILAEETTGSLGMPAPAPRPVVPPSDASKSLDTELVRFNMPELPRINLFKFKKRADAALGIKDGRATNTAAFKSISFSLRSMYGNLRMQVRRRKVSSETANKAVELMRKIVAFWKGGAVSGVTAEALGVRNRWLDELDAILKPFPDNGVPVASTAPTTPPTAAPTTATATATTPSSEPLVDPAKLQKRFEVFKQNFPVIMGNLDEIVDTIFVSVGVRSSGAGGQPPAQQQKQEPAAAEQEPQQDNSKLASAVDNFLKGLKLQDGNAIEKAKPVVIDYLNDTAQQSGGTNLEEDRTKDNWVNNLKLKLRAVKITPQDAETIAKALFTKKNQILGSLSERVRLNEIRATDPLNAVKIFKFRLKLAMQNFLKAITVDDFKKAYIEVAKTKFKDPKELQKALSSMRMMQEAFEQVQPTEYKLLDQLIRNKGMKDAQGKPVPGLMAAFLSVMRDPAVNLTQVFKPEQLQTITASMKTTLNKAMAGASGAEGGLNGGNQSLAYRGSPIAEKMLRLAGVIRG